MASDSMNDTNPDVSTYTSVIERLIQVTRRLLRSTWVATGLGVCLGLFLTTLVAVTLFDLASPLWPALRFIGLLALVVPSVWLFFIGVLRPLFRRLTQAMVARRIEQELPGIHNRLVSCVDLSSNGQRAHSRAFHERLISEAYDRVRSFRASRVLDLLSLRRATLFAAFGVGTFLAAMLIFSDRLPTAVARILNPFADIPPASGVLYDVLIDDQVEPGDHATLRGEPVAFNVLLRKGAVDPPGGRDPLRLEVYTVDEDGFDKKLRYNFAKMENDKTQFTLTSMQHSFSYRVFGGGTWSKKYDVEMLERPRIVGLQTALYYPEYMRRPEPRLGPANSADVIGPVESNIQVTVDVEGDASEAEIELLEKKSVLVDVLNRNQRVWMTEDHPEGAKKQGTWEADEESLGKTGHAHPAKAGHQQHGFDNAPVAFEVLPGESLFVEVYLPEDQLPETIMLKLHDGKNWEHRAFWGADKIAEGQPETVSRYHAGDLPQAGKLVRLEVPASALELESQKIRGVMFASHGGKVVWGAMGSLPPAQKRVTQLVTIDSFIMRPLESGDDLAANAPEQVRAKWVGKFKLRQNGFYRVAIRNRIKHANRLMDEGKLTALPDAPPQVVIERPSKALVVSQPVKVPVFITAYDDFGLDDITVSIQKPGSESFQGRPIKKYEPPQQSENTVFMIDLAEEGLEMNQTLKYRVEVRDTKGQSATTEDRTIQIAENNPAAADQQYARYQEKTETLQDKFKMLVEEQTKAEEAAEKLAEKYEELTEQVEQAKAEAEADADPNVPPEQQPPIALDEEGEQQLEELRQELAEVKSLEDRAVGFSQEVANELKQMADQSAQLDLLPQEITEQVQGVQEAFEDLAMKPLKDVQALVNESMQASQSDPQLPEIEQRTEDVAQTLQDLKERIDFVAQAQEMARDNAEQAIAELQENLLKQNTEIASRELVELREAIAEMREDLGELQGEQQELMADTSKDLSDRLLEKVMEAQDQLEADAEPVLEDARELLASEQLEDVREAADAPPLEPALAEPLSAPEADALAEAKDKSKQQDATEKNVADAAKKKGEPAESPATPQQQELQARQTEQAEELANADEALAADQKILEDLIDSLASQLPEEAQGELTPEQAAQLEELLNAQTTRDALAMFQRLEQMLAQQDQPPNAPNQPPQPSAPQTENELTEIGKVDAILVELDELDLNARVVIMKMQPREREELLQGLKEEGPEGYRKFIRDYFRRLTKVRATK